MVDDTGELETGKHQKTAAILYNHGLAVHIVTKNDDWYNGFIHEFNVDCILIFDRIDCLIFVDLCDIEIIEQFRGDLSTLKKVEINE